MPKFIGDHLLEENGVTYSRTPIEGWTEYPYHWEHRLTKKAGKTSIWCQNLADCLVLMNKWNRTPNWKFYV